MLKLKKDFKAKKVLGTRWVSDDLLLNDEIDEILVNAECLISKHKIAHILNNMYCVKSNACINLM